MILRAAVLCALVAFGLAPQSADAHAEDMVVTAEVHAATGDEDHRHNPIEEALGHCHPGLDCALAAVVVQQARLLQVVGLDGEKFRPCNASHEGTDLSYGPPPPRDFV